MDVREKLIAEVKRNPALYDKTDEDYKKYEVRTQIWTSIGRKCGISAADAQAKWKNLRDNMVKHLRRNLNVKAPKEPKQYKFAKMLEFIVPYLEISRTHGMTDNTSGVNLDCQNEDDHIKVVSDEGSSSDDNTAQEEENNSLRTHGVTDNTNGVNLDCQNVHDNVKAASDEGSSSDDNTAPEEENNGIGGSAGQVQSNSASSPSLLFSNSCSGPPTKRQRHSLPCKIDPGLVDHPSQNVDRVEQDEIGLFLSSMAGSIRKFPASVQARVRFSIHKIVHDAEMEFLYPRVEEAMK